MKRRRTDGYDLSVQPSTPSTRQLVLEEIDLELGLRQRLSDTVRSRLTWALLLQEALENNLQGTNDTGFQDAALDTLQVLEKPCNILLERDITIFEKPVLLLSLSQPSTALGTPEAPSTPQFSARNSSSRIRGLPRAPLQPARKLLYLRNTSTDPPAIAKLACPDCARSDFSNLQGLLNHCRLRHGREYGSHDECMQSCAILVPDEERDTVVATGTEVGGISLPSLRRLFEIAVGAGDKVLIPGIRPREEKSAAAAQETSSEAQDQIQSTHVTRTLGHHKDTPALAPFLGRAPKRRTVHVYDDLATIVDIVSVNDRPTDSTEQAKPRWRMPYRHRNIARPELDEVPPDLPEGAPQSENSGPQKGLAQASVSAVPNVASSRFHIVARVKVADHSLWLSQERRPVALPEYTHRWRLSVSSPSYSLHITTFLAKLTVTCLTDPPPAPLAEPIVVTAPPFIATGATDRPFLARLTFTWVGNQNAPMDVDHWVELDPLRLAHAILGDEQVFDVELDRNTELLPLRGDTRKVGWHDDDHEHSTSTLRALGCDKSMGREDGTGDTAADSGYEATLRALLSQVPITAKGALYKVWERTDILSESSDVKARAAPQAPLMLVPSRAQWKNTVLGRRKAVEMSRARALREAYERHVVLVRDKSAHPPLTTADIYRWMVDNDVFPRLRDRAEHRAREAPTEGAVQIRPKGDSYCHFCGLNSQVHPTGVKTEETERKGVPAILAPSNRKNLSACLTFNGGGTRLPVFDVRRLLDQALSPGSVQDMPYGVSKKLLTASKLTANSNPAPAALLSIAHPQFVTAIRSMTERWNLEHCEAPVHAFSRIQDGLIARTELSRSRQEMVDHLAPYALLAAVTNSMIRLLVRSGADAVGQDEAALRSLRGRRKAGSGLGGARRVMTPSHVVRGLVAGAQRGSVEAAALLCVARLGIGKDHARTQVAGVVGIDSKVKMEEEDLGVL
ncbi:hypothetical protein IEO21_01177 [Rhodonia placenta]|uniref:YEATS domain-containing protein n=1 Tax=Rhodonia placenta TaxID=104341 RepID=A0A8H7U5J6_9APHY|nr:hypothetical protein IEO21_01177 [Postia placenta]